MGGSDKLKDEAEKELQEHPEQVEETEQAIENKTGVLSQDNEAAKRDDHSQA
jgi:hypothetical protein